MSRTPAETRKTASDVHVTAVDYYVGIGLYNLMIPCWDNRIVAAQDWWEIVLDGE